MDLVIEGKVLFQGTFQQCCIGITDGKIQAIKKILKGDSHQSFGTCCILPAGVDMHVHFRDPGMTQKETFASGSKAAAFGGLSCVCDMPNTIPPTTTLQALSDKIAHANETSYIDFGVYAGVTETNLSLMKELGIQACGFKVFLGSTTQALVVRPQFLKEILSMAQSVHKLVLVHAEDEMCLKQHQRSEQNLADHLCARPASCEIKAIQNVVNADRAVQTPVHICHLSSIEGFELLHNRPSYVSCGVTPHHALLEATHATLADTCLKVNPPIRTDFDRTALFAAVSEGVVDVLESDHAPHTVDEKTTNFAQAPAGLPGVETLYPLFLYMAKKGAITFQQLTSLVCQKPAKLLHIPKGDIVVGNDADLIVVDMKVEHTVQADRIHSKCGWTPFEGWPALYPSHLFVRGEPLIADYELQSRQGFGHSIGG
jgi:dihydroorotase